MGGGCVPARTGVEHDTGEEILGGGTPTILQITMRQSWS